MKERPIMFSAPMVRALLNCTKSQTRRVVKPQPLPPVARWVMSDHWWIPEAISERVKQQFITTWPDALRCPYGQPGDRLWVREAFALIDKDYKPADLASASALVYRADGLKVPNQRDRDIRRIFADRCRIPLDAIKWRPSIHMPRIASRITLEIVSVRVERLQEISVAGAMAEGVGIQCESPMAIMEYSLLWESINGPGSWDANPWVWVVEFKRVQA